jgi:hypothetical protein
LGALCIDTAAVALLMATQPTLFFFRIRSAKKIVRHSRRYGL